MSLYIAYHGGWCCGVKHIWNFDLENSKKNLETLKGFLAGKLQLEVSNRADGRPTKNMVYSSDYRAGVYEVCLKELQWALYHDGLLKIGFKVVNEFYNPNSGNMVRIYHYLAFQPS